MDSRVEEIIKEALFNTQLVLENLTHLYYMEVYFLL